MRYEVRHRTTYEYDHDVSLSHHLARLTPRELPHQRCEQHRLTTDPADAARSAHTDHFGNIATFLTIEGPHRRLEISSLSLVDVSSPVGVRPEETVPWERVAELLTSDPPGAPADVTEFVFGSPLVPVRPEFADYAKLSFPPGRPLLAGALDLTGRIHQDFAFDARATTVTTPVAEFFKARRGVCQDFAQFTIACLRSLSLPARYISGYLETLPPPGQAKIAGADASHAWIAVWCELHGWIDLDPTNHLLPSERHITIARGRDFSDVSPLRGVIVGSGAHHLAVAVDVVPLAGEPKP